MAGISTVFWDVGGVLLTNGWDHPGRSAVLTYFDLDRAEFERRHETVNDAWEKGEITVNDYLAATVFYQPRNFTPADFLDQMKAQSIELPQGGLGILRKVAASSNVTLAVLNNESRELNDYRFEHFGLRSIFSSFLSSCYLGLRKPDPAIYRRALDIMQRSPEETAFIDDREGNVAAAAAVGIHGIQFKDPAQLSAELTALGVAVADG
jgi:putative hydrolase of the HAD superfamily